MRAIVKFAALIVVFLLFILPAFLTWMLRLHQAQAWVVTWFFRLCIMVIGVRINTEGMLTAHRPLMLVTNHCSYLDIFVIAAIYPVAFTPKSDIKYWPVVNIMALCGDSVFVERKPAKLPKTRQLMQKRLLDGKVVCLFPEGTTSEGDAIKPFKSGFFSMAESEELKELQVQPATVAYTHVDGQLITSENRRAISWVDDMALLPHLFRLLNYRSINVTVQFHEAVSIQQFASRKELCQHCETVVDAYLKKLLLKEVA